MATKKPVKPEEEALEEVAEEAQAAEGPKSSWDEMVDMIVPRKPKGEDQQFYICVNDRRYAVPANGKMQKLPRPVAEILKESIEAEYEAQDYADHMPNQSADGAI